MEKTITMPLHEYYSLNDQHNKIIDLKKEIEKLKESKIVYSEHTTMQMHPFYENKASIQYHSKDIAIKNLINSFKKEKTELEKLLEISGKNYQRLLNRNLFQRIFNIIPEPGKGIIMEKFWNWENKERKKLTIDGMKTESIGHMIKYIRNHYYWNNNNNVEITKKFTNAVYAINVYDELENIIKELD